MLPARPAIPRARAFSLIELVIVMTILGIVAAIAVPRMSRGAETAAQSAAAADLAALNLSLEHYAAEHNGSYPAPGTIAAQLTRYTDEHGNVSATKVAPFILGPYIKKVPVARGARNKDAAGIAQTDGASVGWIYDETKGVVRLNAD